MMMNECTQELDGIYHEWWQLTYVSCLCMYVCLCVCVCLSRYLVSHDAAYVHIQQLVSRDLLFAIVLLFFKIEIIHFFLLQEELATPPRHHRTGYLCWPRIPNGTAKNYGRNTTEARAQRPT